MKPNNDLLYRKPGKAHIAISFDDGRKDNVDIIERMLLAHKIPTTLYITTGYVDGSCPENKLPTEKPPMSIKDVVNLYQNPLVEIGMHGDMHLNEDWDIQNGRNKLLNWLGLDSSYTFGFASPSTAFPIDYFVQSNNPLYDRDISYLAVGLRNSSHRKMRTLARKGSRIIHSRLLYETAYSDTMMMNCPDRVIYRVPVLGDIRYKQLRTLVEEAIRKQKSIVFMFHSIDDHSDDTWTWSTSNFERLTDYLLQQREMKKLELMTVEELHMFLSNLRR